MQRSIVPPWLLHNVLEVAKSYGLGAHDVLFSPVADSNVEYLDAISFQFRKAHPDIYRKIRSRVWAATRFNGDVDAVKLILSM